MKLFEITSRVDVKLGIALVNAIEKFTGNSHDEEAEAIKILEGNYNNPQLAPFMYSGPLYRVVSFDGEVDPTKQDILKYQGGRTLYSFAKTEEGVEAFLDIAAANIEPPLTLVIFKQQGRGYDTQKIYRYVRQFSKDDLEQAGIPPKLFNLQRAGATFKNSDFEGTVKEVIAPLSPNGFEILQTEHYPEWEDDDWD